MKKLLLILLMMFCLTGCSNVLTEEAKAVNKTKAANYVTVYAPDGSVKKEGYFLDYVRYSEGCVDVYFDDGEIITHSLWVQFEYREK